jgi:hypothetical protein
MGLYIAVIHTECRVILRAVVMRQFKTNAWCVMEVKLILGEILVLHHSCKGDDDVAESA